MRRFQTFSCPCTQPVGLEYSIVALACLFSWRGGQPVMQQSGTRASGRRGLVSANLVLEH